MSKLHTRQIGNIQEDLACRFLESKGLAIIDRNYYVKNFGEIDIVAREMFQVDGAVCSRIVFVEVRSTFSGYSAVPKVILGERKKRRFAICIEIWMQRNGFRILEDDIRADLLVIKGHKGQVTRASPGNYDDHKSIVWIKGII